MTTRGDILSKSTEIIEESGLVKTIKRQRPSETTFKSLSNQSFPYLVLETPAPSFKGRVKASRSAFSPVTKFKFDLPVSLTVYDKIVGEIDENFGEMYNSVFKLFFTDPSFFNLATEVAIDPEGHALVDMGPYYAFRMKIIFSYTTLSGI